MRSAFLPLLSCIAAASQIKTTVTVGSFQHETLPEYVSFNLDVHDKSEEYPAWVNSSAINGVDFKDPDLVFLTSQLAPAVLRIGGSEEDITVYALEPGIECEPVPHVGNFCLTADRWQEMTDFGATTGARISFGLNAMYGRNSSSSRFNASQVEQMFQYTSQHINQDGLYGFQFGNELEHKIDAPQYAADLALVRQMLDNSWPDASKRPKLVAPDENPDPEYVKAVLSDSAIKADTIDGLTWHQYTGYGLDPNLGEKMQHESWFNPIKVNGQEISEAAHSVFPNLDMWVGETAAAWHSGRDNVTNAFISSMWATVQLGQYAGQVPHAAQCRQTLIGGYYEIIDKTTITPNPDYYLYRLWKQLLGTRSLVTDARQHTGGEGNNQDNEEEKEALKVGPDPHAGDMYAFAHCPAKPAMQEAARLGLTRHTLFSSESAPSGVSMLAVNIGGDQNSTMDVEVTPSSSQLGAGSMVPRMEYVLTPPEGEDVFSRRVALNGQVLQYVKGSGSLPEMKPRVVTDPSTPLLIEPRTVVFVVFPQMDSPGSCG